MTMAPIGASVRPSCVSLSLTILPSTPAVWAALAHVKAWPAVPAAAFFGDADASDDGAACRAHDVTLAVVRALDAGIDANADRLVALDAALATAAQVSGPDGGGNLLRLYGVSAFAAGLVYGLTIGGGR